MISFVYVQGLKGPEPQVWHDTPFKAAGAPVTPLQSVELADIYAGLPLSQLETLYPYKGAPNVA